MAKIKQIYTELQEVGLTEKEIEKISFLEKVQKTPEERESDTLNGEHTPYWYRKRIKILNS